MRRFQSSHLAALQDANCRPRHTALKSVRSPRADPPDVCCCYPKRRPPPKTPSSRATPSRRARPRGIYKSLPFDAPHLLQQNSELQPKTFPIKLHNLREPVDTASLTPMVNLNPINSSHSLHGSDLLNHLSARDSTPSGIVSPICFGVLLLPDVIHQISLNNFRPDNEQTRIIRLDNNPHPVHIRTAKDFDASEIF